MTKKCVVVFSSGMDSTVVLHHCLKEYEEVYCLTFDYNQRHRSELENIEYQINDIKRKYKNIIVYWIDSFCSFICSCR